MKKTKLTELLSSFTSAEIKKFKIFLNSPYFNTKPQFIHLFEVLSKFHPDYEKISDEEIFSEIYPNKTYSYTIFKNNMSDLYELVKTFMAIEEITADKLVIKNSFLNNLMLRHNLIDLISKEINIAEQLYEKEKLDTSYFEYNYLYKRALTRYYSVNQRDKYINSSDEEIESFYRMVLYNMLIYGMFFEASSVDSNTGTMSTVIFELIEKIYETLKDKKPVNEIFYKTLKLLKTEDEKYYYEITEMLKNENEFLNNSSKLWVYQPLEAFLIRRVRNGETKFYRPQFELYKHCFETGIYDNNYAFAQGKLITTVEPAVRVREFEWIENLINKFRGLGPVEQRENYYNFSMAKVLHAKGDNDKALELLNKIDPDFMQIKTLVRNMQMKIYYELGFFELAKSQIDAYRHYIAREKEFSPEYVESVNNFLKIYNKLIELKIDKNSAKLEDLEFEINKTKHIVLREWLKEKTSELK